MKMKKMLFAATSALLLVLLLSGTVLAAEPTAPASSAFGEPQIDMDKYGYYLWFDGDRFHLRTTDRGNGPDASIYTGVVTARGGDNIRLHDVFKGEDTDWAVAAGKKLDFHFRTYNRVDGVDFSAPGATHVTFRLYRNGHLIVTDHIFLGAGQHNPPGNPFTLAT